MSRRRHPSYLETIEYIGPRPQKPQAPRKKPNFLAGWLVLLLALGLGYKFGKPLLLPLLQAEQRGATAENTELLIGQLQTSVKPGDRLAAAALQATRRKVMWDEAYYQISPENGDIPANRGKAEDLVVRSYRAAVGVDLQVLVNEDMSHHFQEYPQIFGRAVADPNIDHRMTANLQRFFLRAGAALTVKNAQGEAVPSTEASDYLPGDIVTWRLVGGSSHIGIVVPGPGTRADERWVVHNIGQGPVWEDSLFDYRIIGHYRYFPKN